MICNVYIVASVIIMIVFVYWSCSGKIAKQNTMLHTIIPANKYKRAPIQTDKFKVREYSCMMTLGLKD